MMNTQNTDGMRELTVDERREIEGGVTEGGCISPDMQKLLDLINWIGTP